MEQLERTNMPILLLDWFHDYLNGREQCVDVNNTKSIYRKVGSGVPQGSVLGPVLYILATSSLKSIHLSTDTNIVAYADDLLIMKPLIKVNDLPALNNDISNIVQYFQGMSMEINAAKTGFMVMSLCNRVAPQHTLRVLDHDVAMSTQIKYLGITLDRQLNFQTHIKMVTNKARRMIGAFRSCFLRWCPSRVFAKVYLTCIRPALAYGHPLVCGITATGDNQLSRIDHLATRICPQCSSALSLPESANLVMIKNMHKAIRQGGPLSALFIPVHERRSARIGNSHQRRANWGVRCPPTARTLKTFIERACKMWNGISDELVCI
jgi:hypothetical protein